MSHIVYDKVINVVLHQEWVEKGITYSALDIGADIDPTNTVSVQTIQTTKYNGHFVIKCDDMQLKPNIKVKFSALPDGICYGCTVTVTNLMYSLDIQRYVAMDITLGYRYTDDSTSSLSTVGTSFSGTKAKTVTLKSPIFTSYQTSPNPDGETIFEGVVVGNMFDVTEDCPVYLKLHTTEEETEDNDGNKITNRVCRVPLDEFLRMIATSRGNVIKYDPVSKQTTTTPNEKSQEEIKEHYNDPDTYTTESNGLDKSYKVFMQLPGPSSGAAAVVGNLGERMRKYEIDISSLSSKSTPTFMSLIKNAGDIIHNQLEAAFGIRTLLTLWNDKLILLCPDFPGTNFQENDPYQSIDYVYSCSYEATLLRVSAPFIPTIYPGCLIKVSPTYYNGASLPNVVDALSYAILEQGVITASDIINPVGYYSVLTMDVEFGTYDGNTMNLLCVPIKLSSDSRQTQVSPEESMNGYLAKMQDKWDEEHINDLDYSCIIVGDPDAVSKEVTDIYSCNVDHNAYTSLTMWLVRPGDSLSLIAKQVGWGTNWDAAAYANAQGKTNFEYVRNVTTDGAITKAIFTGKEKVYIPFNEFWPTIIGVTKSVLNDASQKDLTTENCSIFFEENNPDSLHRDNTNRYVMVPGISDDVINSGTEAAHKELFLYAGKWAMKKLSSGSPMYSTEDVKHLYNIYVFLGGNIADVE